MVNQNILDADPFGFGRFVNTPERKVIILWDYENCPVPKGASGLSAIRNIREAALKFGSIDQFEAYCDWSDDAYTGIKNDLSNSGVKNGWDGTVDKTIIIDMIVYALDRPRTTTIFLISGERDHAYAISTLRNRGYPVKLLAPSGALHSALQVLADLLDWNSIFKPDLPPAELIDLSALAGGEEEDADEEEDEEDETSEEEDEGEEEEEEEEPEAEEIAPVQLGSEMGADKSQVRVGVEAEAEEPAQVQVDAEETTQAQIEAGEKVQVLVETADEADSEELTPPTPPRSEPIAPLTPTGIPPMWIPGEPALLSKVVPLEPLSARAQERQEEQPRSLPRPLPSPSPPTQPHMVSPSNGGGSSPPWQEESLLEEPVRYIPPKFFDLVQELEAMKAEGSPAPRWTSVCLRVYKRLPSVLSKAGVKKWKDYMLLAEKEGI
ncbi:hypothetical protein FRC05_005522, partial [Tulasnella sp. 425]